MSSGPAQRVTLAPAGPSLVQLAWTWAIEREPDDGVHEDGLN